MRTCEKRRCRCLSEFDMPPVTETAIFEEEAPTGVDKAIKVDTVAC